MIAHHCQAHITFLPGPYRAGITLRWSWWSSRLPCRSDRCGFPHQNLLHYAFLSYRRCSALSLFFESFGAAICNVSYYRTENRSLEIPYQGRGIITTPPLPRDSGETSAAPFSTFIRSSRECTVVQNRFLYNADNVEFSLGLRRTAFIVSTPRLTILPHSDCLILVRAVLRMCTLSEFYRESVFTKRSIATTTWFLHFYLSLTALRAIEVQFLSVVHTFHMYEFKWECLVTVEMTSTHNTL